jgi:hypothetical protein
MTSDGGKGSTPRPTDHEAFSKAWELIKWSKNAPPSNTPKPADRPHSEPKKD